MNQESYNNHKENNGIESKEKRIGKTELERLLRKAKRDRIICRIICSLTIHEHSYQLPQS